MFSRNFSRKSVDFLFILIRFLPGKVQVQKNSSKRNELENWKCKQTIHEIMSEETETQEFFDAVESQSEFATEEDLTETKLKIEKTLEKLKNKPDFKLKNELIGVLTKIQDILAVKNDETEIEISEISIESTQTSVLSMMDDKVQNVLTVPIQAKDQTFEEFRDPQLNFKQSVQISYPK